jgi:membrane protein DedA with SNARE-associated domain
MQPFLDWFADHRLALVLVSSAIDATGFPFPGRLILVVAGAFAVEAAELALMVVLSTVGFVIGDHALYGAGALGGPRLLTWYCRLTLASERCVESTIAYFKRFGASAVLLGRFSFGVRLFAAVLSGAGHIRYRWFLAFDAAGAVVYAILWIGVGRLFGMAVMERAQAVRVLVLIGPAAILTLLVFRFARRRRYGAASSQRLARSGADPVP